MGSLRDTTEWLNRIDTILHSGCTNLHSHQKQTRGATPPHPLQLVLFIEFLMMVILTSVRWHFFAVVICMSLMINDVEYVSMSSLAIYMFSSDKCLFRSSTHFLIGFFNLNWVLWAVFYILEINPFTVASFAKSFSQFEGCLLFCLWFPFLITWWLIGHTD